MDKSLQGQPVVKKSFASNDSGQGDEGQSPVLVVGIGVSACGLESLKRFLAVMRPGCGVTIVLIQHLEPSHERITAGQVRDYTELPVVEVSDGMAVAADRIHLVPRDQFFNINRNILTLHEPPNCNGLTMPIDHFFCSLATDRGHRGCGILMSGLGSDGVLGFSEIRSAGGRTLAEDPAGAACPEMPQSAIDAGVVDEVLSAERMAEAVVALAKHIGASPDHPWSDSTSLDAELHPILDLLRVGAGHDFRCYKPNTLIRRIHRRMALMSVDSFADYTRFVEEHPDEVALLRKDLLIGVTEFFRQPQAWKMLEEKAITPLVEHAETGAELRFWVPGCSTGNEAYSLAMLLCEQIEKSGRKIDFQIFATDPDVASLAIARTGIYSEDDIKGKVSPERRRRFFTHHDGRYRIVKDLRDQIVFAPQNLASDPPFSRLDLISCRNLLIYLDPQVQKKVIALFHFALREGGVLFLGTAETVGDNDDLFEPVSKKWRIYRRMGVGRRMGVEIPLYSSGELRPTVGRLAGAASGPKLSLASVAQQMLIDRFAPACVIIDRKLQVLYLHGAVEGYLTFPSGELTTRIVDMAREGLRSRLRGAIAQCIKIKRLVSVTARVRRADKSIPVKTTVSPFRWPQEGNGLLLVTFEDYHVPVTKSRRQTTDDNDVRQLQDELKITREELQSTIEQLESSNDLLKASNEEVTASNEELQSANEELETSKEELQSLNEELNITNTRLEEKVEELERINNDILNLLSSTNIATVFLDKELRVKRYTPAITSLFSLIPSDLGRPIVDIVRRFSDQALLEDARRVLTELSPIAREVEAGDGRWYIRRITPYRTQDDRIDGVVITFGEVTELKRSEQRNHFLVGLLERSDQPFCVSYPDGTFGLINGAFERLTGYSRNEIKTIDWSDNLTPVEWREHERARLEELHRTKRPVRYEKEYIRKDGTRVPIAVLVHLMTDEQGRPLHYYSFITDITERKQAEERIERQNLILKGINRIFQEAISTNSEEDLGRTCLEVAEELTGSKLGFIGETGADGWMHDVVISNPGWELCTMHDKTGHRKLPGAFKIHGLYGRVLLDGRSVLTNTPEVHPDSIGTPPGHPRLESFLGVPLIRDGQTIGMVAVANRRGGFTEAEQEMVEALTPAIVEAFARKRAEVGLKESEARFRLLSTTAGRLLTSEDPQGIVNELCEAVLEELDCQIFFNFLVDERVGKLSLNAFAGIPKDEVDNIKWLDYGTSVCGCVASAGERIVAEDVLHKTDSQTELVRSYGIKAYACHPLTAHGRTIGTLSFGTKTRDCFSSQDLALMKTVADQVATAMERKRLIEELRQSRDELEARVEERTAELKTINEALERSNRDLEDFAHVASHDLQEPLRKIQTFSDRLKAEYLRSLDDKAQDYLERMHRAAERMQALILDLLQYSAISSELHPATRFTLTEAVEEAMMDLAVLIEETEGQVELSALPEIEADRTQMRRLFQNLIGNALKYRGKERPVIKVFERSPSSTPFMEIHVEDNGIGFDEKYIDRIFKPFQRLHGRGAQYSGTGMGLAICRKIVERHGGSITAGSRPGQGTVFIVRLPRKSGLGQEKRS